MNLFYQRSPRTKGFSFVEMLSAVAIIGLISFLAIPNLVKVRSDSERNVAIARAESINMAMATYVQARGRTQAASDWSGSSAGQAKYALVSSYLSYAEASLTDYLPTGYSITFNGIDPLQKVTLKQGTTIIAY